ncbi:MAG: class I SAM-dependent methyltransferase [Streptosporangiaceae bacterium]|jgi:SAM-dependent methyltransferase
MPELDQVSAQRWIDRWERQQEVSLPDREERFTALIDAVADGTGQADPLVIDLGCGPGSLSVRLLGRLPQATVVAVDADPVTLTLGRTAYAGRPGLRFAELDLRTPGWAAALGLDAPADAAVSTTALHWLSEPQLRAVYAELATVLRPGGLLLDGDHLGADAAATPALAALERALLDRQESRRFPDGDDESWLGWWQAVSADPALARLAAERDRRSVDSGHHSSSPSSLLATHVDALRAAGFTEIGTLWQRGADRLLCGVLGGGP